MEQQKAAGKILKKAISSGKYDSKINCSLKKLKQMLDSDIMLKEKKELANECEKLTGQESRELTYDFMKIMRKIERIENETEKIETANLLFRYPKSPLFLDNLTSDQILSLNIALCRLTSHKPGAEEADSVVEVSENFMEFSKILRAEVNALLVIRKASDKFEEITGKPSEGLKLIREQNFDAGLEKLEKELINIKSGEDREAVAVALFVNLRECLGKMGEVNGKRLGYMLRNHLKREILTYEGTRIKISEPYELGKFEILSQKPQE